MIRILYHISRLFLGAVFIYASIDKIIHPHAFAQAVFNYQILPGFLVNMIALALPWLELVLGGCLILNRWMPGSVLIGNVLLIVFMGAILLNLARGLDVSCGCFSTGAEEGPITMITLMRDASFLFPALYLLISTFILRDHINEV